MRYIVFCSAVCAAILASTLSAPVGPSHYGSPHGSNNLQRTGAYHQGGPHGPHTARSRGGQYGSAPSHSRGGPGYLRAAPHVPSATFGSPYGAPGSRHIPGPVSTHGDLPRGGPYGGPVGGPVGGHGDLSRGGSYGGHGDLSRGGSYGGHRDLSRGGSYGGPVNDYHQGPSRRYHAGPANLGHGQGPRASSFHREESKTQNYGREMKYTVRDPHSKGTTHVTETHVVTNRQMHGAEAEAAMKKIMGNMGPGGGHGGFSDFVKDLGVPFY